MKAIALPATLGGHPETGSGGGVHFRLQVVFLWPTSINKNRGWFEYPETSWNFSWRGHLRCSATIWPLVQCTSFKTRSQMTRLGGWESREIEAYGSQIKAVSYTHNYIVIYIILLVCHARHSVYVFVYIIHTCYIHINMICTVCTYIHVLHASSTFGSWQGFIMQADSYPELHQPAFLPAKLAILARAFLNYLWLSLLPDLHPWMVRSWGEATKTMMGHTTLNSLWFIICGHIPS